MHCVLNQDEDVHEENWQEKLEYLQRQITNGNGGSELELRPLLVVRKKIAANYTYRSNDVACAINRITQHQSSPRSRANHVDKGES